MSIFMRLTDLGYSDGEVCTLILYSRSTDFPSASESSESNANVNSFDRGATLV